MASRVAGDEFVIVMNGLEDPTEAMKTAWRIVETFHAPFFTSGMESFVTASVGVAIATPMQGVTSDVLLLQANTAMYAAKAQGRDIAVQYTSDLHSIVSARLKIENDLFNALASNQLEVWYQPDVDLETGEVICVEALLRWHHPDGSVWTAERFIDVAENTGLILSIGNWVLLEVCRQAAAWAVARPERPMHVRVNVSADQLADRGFLNAIDAALNSSGVDPGLLGVEITETVLLRETMTVNANIGRLRERRIGIALDDFGTGFASLMYLRRFEIDLLKIDRSFIRNLENSDTDRQITDSVISLAATLGMKVTAEGVETANQASLLRQMGCPSAQGWFFSAALPPAEVALLFDHIFETS